MLTICTQCVSVCCMQRQFAQRSFSGQKCLADGVAAIGCPDGNRYEKGDFFRFCFLFARRSLQTYSENIVSALFRQPHNSYRSLFTAWVACDALVRARTAQCGKCINRFDIFFLVHFSFTLHSAHHHKYDRLPGILSSINGKKVISRCSCACVFVFTITVLRLTVFLLNENQFDSLIDFLVVVSFFVASVKAGQQQARCMSIDFFRPHLREKPHSISISFWIEWMMNFLVASLIPHSPRLSRL